MRKAAIIMALLASAGPASAQYLGQRNSGYGYGTGSNPSSTYVTPHMNRDGSYTGGHYRTTPNNTQFDNYGTRGNVNPYTGNVGTRSPYR